MKITSLMHTAFAVALLLLTLPAAPVALAASPAATFDVQATPPSDSQTTPPDSAPPRGFTPYIGSRQHEAIAVFVCFWLALTRHRTVCGPDQRAGAL